jgi:hypothetical protein
LLLAARLCQPIALINLSRGALRNPSSFFSKFFPTWAHQSVVYLVTLHEGNEACQQKGVMTARHPR